MVRPLLLGLVIGILVGCSTLGFTYRFYALQSASYDGKLIADKPENDLSFSVCAPDAAVKQKCVIMLSAEFYRMKGDYEAMGEELKRCQKFGCSAGSLQAR